MATTFSHLVIPDTQVRPGIRLDYLRWAGQYAVDHFISKQRPVRLVHLGDHHDMESLSSYDKKGGKLRSGKRLRADIDAGNEGWLTMDEPITDYLRANKRTAAPVDKHKLLGNHEDRITRAIEQDDEILEGLISLDDLEHTDWAVHPFLKPVTLDGVVYAHYFVNKGTGRAMSGENLKLRLKNLGHSFTMGHQQTFDYAVRFVNGQMQCALVAGSYYVHDEAYLGPQGNSHWRGLVVCHQVSRGGYNIMQVDIDYLCRKYEGIPFHKYKTRHYG